MKDVIPATTTSTQDSGLLDVLVPKFEEETGYKVKPSLWAPELPWPWVKRAKPMCCFATLIKMKQNLLKRCRHQPPACYAQ